MAGVALQDDGAPCAVKMVATTVSYSSGNAARSSRRASTSARWRAGALWHLVHRIADLQTAIRVRMPWWEWDMFAGSSRADDLVFMIFDITRTIRSGPLMVANLLGFLISRCFSRRLCTTRRWNRIMSICRP